MIASAKDQQPVDGDISDKASQFGTTPPQPKTAARARAKWVPSVASSLAVGHSDPPTKSITPAKNQGKRSRAANSGVQNRRPYLKWKGYKEARLVQEMTEAARQGVKPSFIGFAKEFNIPGAKIKRKARSLVRAELLAKVGQYMQYMIEAVHDGGYRS